MHITLQTFWLPKAGNGADEYEDAFWPPVPIKEREAARFRCAVADGATETSFSALWAGLLVREISRQSLRRFLKAVPRLQQEWRQEVTAQPLPWYAEEKVRSGAYAALLGLTVERAAPELGHFAVWNAAAIGDSCLFQMRGDCLRVVFPVERAEQFDSRPYLLGTGAQNPAQWCDHLTLVGGTCEPGDTFYLLTDALACWFLRQQEAGESGDVLQAIRTPADFKAFAQEQRPQRDADGRPLLRNDDMTLMRLEIAS
jgi:hypothetical protein